jgi:hypothetical protein
MAMGTGAAIGAGEVRDRRDGHYSSVMPGLVPGIHVLLCCETKDVDGRDKPGHDARGGFANLCSSQFDFCSGHRNAGRVSQQMFHAKEIGFQGLRKLHESIRRSRLTFISITTSCATVSLDKGAF